MQPKIHDKIVCMSDYHRKKRDFIILKLVMAYEKPLKRFLRTKLVLEPDRDDIVQETYLRLMRQDGLEERLSNVTGSTLAYLFSIATNILIDRERREKVRGKGFRIAYEDEMDTGSSLSPEDELQSKQKLMRVERVLKRLDYQCRRAFILSRFETKSYREVADDLGVSVSMVEKYISRALKALREDRIRQEQ